MQNTMKNFTVLTVSASNVTIQAEVFRITHEGKILSFEGAGGTVAMFPLAQVVGVAEESAVV